MKVIFLHGLGQDASSWDRVIEQLPHVSCVALNLFENGEIPRRFIDLEMPILDEINKTEEDVVLVGLSLGAMLGLSLITRSLPQVKGLVAIAGQYKLNNNLAYRLQFHIFRLLPNIVFRKMGQDKQSLLALYQNLSDFDLTEKLKEVQQPVLLLCGDRDKINHKASKEMFDLLPKAQFDLLEGAGHDVNQQLPEPLARTVEEYLLRIS